MVVGGGKKKPQKAAAVILWLAMPGNEAAYVRSSSAG